MRLFSLTLFPLVLLTAACQPDLQTEELASAKQASWFPGTIWVDPCIFDPATPGCPPPPPPEPAPAACSPLPSPITFESWGHGPLFLEPSSALAVITLTSPTYPGRAVIFGVDVERDWVVWAMDAPAYESNWIVAEIVSSAEASAPPIDPATGSNARRIAQGKIGTAGGVLPLPPPPPPPGVPQVTREYLLDVAHQLVEPLGTPLPTVCTGV